MNDPAPQKLKMAPLEPIDDLQLRLSREARAAQLARENEMEGSLAPFKVGSVPYLNAVPLTRGLEKEVIFAPPAELAKMLKKESLDAALVSITEVLLTGAYDVLDGIAIASLGEVKSVLLAHKTPLESVQEIFCDPASITSVSLLKVLLREKGLEPKFRTLASYNPNTYPDGVLLIGDQALDFLLGPHTHQIWDLGAAWFELTGLPFVYAAWALRRGVENAPLRAKLREARDFGLDTLDHIIRNSPMYDLDFRKDYLGWHIHFHLGTDEKEGLKRFSALLEKHELGPVFPLRFVS